MKRENTIRQRIRSMETLIEAVGAMKSLAAHHLRSARQALPAARAYRTDVDEAIATLGLHLSRSKSNASAMLVVASDLGLCGGYNSRLVRGAIEHHRQLGSPRVYCIGHRPRSALNRAGIALDRLYHAPTGVAGLTDLLLQLCEDLLVDFLHGKFAILDVISAQFQGVGKFDQISTRLLPIDPPQSAQVVTPSPYTSSDHLSSVAIREYLYIRLFQTSLDSLASEHGARLVATESAAEWLSERIEISRRQLTSIRREAATQEVLDIAAGAKRRKH